MSETIRSTVGASTGVGKAKLGVHTRVGLLLVGAVLIVIAVGLGVFMLMKHINGSNNHTQDQAAAKNQSVVSAGNVEASSFGTQTSLDTALQKAKTAQAKSDIYIKKVIVGQANGEPAAKILEYANLAEQAAPTYRTALVLGDLYLSQGNKKLALDYYRQVLSRMTTAEKELAPGQYESYEEKIKNLETQP